MGTCNSMFTLLLLMLCLALSSGARARSSLHTRRSSSTSSSPALEGTSFDYDYGDFGERRGQTPTERPLLRYWNNFVRSVRLPVPTITWNMTNPLANLFGATTEVVPSEAPFVSTGLGTGTGTATGIGTANDAEQLDTSHNYSPGNRRRKHPHKRRKSKNSSKRLRQRQARPSYEGNYYVQYPTSPAYDYRPYRQVGVGGSNALFYYDPKYQAVQQYYQIQPLVSTNYLTGSLQPQVPYYYGDYGDDDVGRPIEHSEDREEVATTATTTDPVPATTPSLPTKYDGYREDDDVAVVTHFDYEDDEARKLKESLASFPDKLRVHPVKQPPTEEPLSTPLTLETTKPRATLRFFLLHPTWQ